MNVNEAIRLAKEYASKAEDLTPRAAIPPNYAIHYVQMSQMYSQLAVALSYQEDD